MFPVNYTIYNKQHNGINFINVIIQTVKKCNGQFWLQNIVKK